MVNEYITRSNVENFIGFTIPAAKQAGVDELISMCCDEFDRLTGNAWRVVSAKNEVYRISLSSNWVQAQKIHLSHRNVKRFSSGAGDKFLVWDGTTWTDWLTTKIEDTDYFLEYELGIMYIRPFVQYPLRTYNLLENVPVRITYRYGDNGGDRDDSTFNIANVPSDVKRAVIKMVAVNLIETNEWYKLLPEGTDRVNLETKVSNWRNDYEVTIKNRKEIRLF